MDESQKQSFEANSPIKGGDIDNDLQLAGDAFMNEMNCAVNVADEVTKLVLDQLATLENQNKKLTHRQKDQVD